VKPDKPSRIFQSAGGHGHQVSARETPHELESDRFARDISARLETARVQHNYEQLYLAAAPEFLGILREHLSDQVAKQVVGSVHHNLVDCSETEIRQRFNID
jgi:protein required for attachment to host cells